MTETMLTEEQQQERADYYEKLIIRLVAGMMIGSFALTGLVVAFF